MGKQGKSRRTSYNGSGTRVHDWDSAEASESVGNGFSLLVEEGRPAHDPHFCGRSHARAMGPADVEEAGSALSVVIGGEG